MYIGSELIQAGGYDTAVTVNDFWRWSFPDFSVPAVRQDFAVFLAASSLGLISDGRGRIRREYDLLWTPSGGSGVRISVRAAACIQSDDGGYPDHIAFDIPAGQTCDVRVFCVFTALFREESPLNTDLWAFYSLCDRRMRRSMAGPENLPLSALISLEPVWSDYYGIGDAILMALSER